ncbi:copper amine oxidase N-terminal domain-containing protein [Paenibacillus sp. F411]|uniref:copper amine oxidase N-terminal domain-containing protein n=1 Tax=Paenibacillus sp. F411 TaxID=2820239 RepID=UPI001AB01513|nr:copper amine oxidase N-terminal domain-containing protein [Paenibacillus sp. F411]MBO2946117.1 copper amine oxidase N-terminal domain-containing protein [Paenibacillus sp. F411]
MKKKLLISLFALTIILSVAAGMVFAKGTIKVVVNGEEIKTDVAPQMSKNRVMVPISFISKSLGANVSWDQKNQTVIIKGKSEIQEDVWDQNLNMSASNWASIKNLIALYMVGFDTRDDKLIRSISVDGFDMIPIGGMYPSIIDYDIMDAQTMKDSVKVRVKVISQEEKLLGQYWDFEIAQGKIKSMKIQHFDISDYTVLPGLTFKNQ